MHTDFLIFDVGLGQSVFVYPHSDPSYGMLVDAGHIADFHPIDFLQAKGFVSDRLSNLTLTNYDQDHFSGLPYLRSRTQIVTVDFPDNLTSADIRSLKPLPHTEALNTACFMRDTYTTPALFYAPPFTKHVFKLRKEDLLAPDTNNLSQVVFVQQNGSVICIGGDLEELGWQVLLRRAEVRAWLKQTNVFVASHHGRENGYCPDVFSDCQLDCVIISDKGITHETQQNAASLYGRHVRTGVLCNGRTRSVLTTRDDGHIWVRFSPGGTRSYGTFTL